MADIVVDGLTRVDFVLLIASKAAPKVSELTAGVPLARTIMLADGMKGWKGTPEKVDNTKLGSNFSTGVPGRTSFDTPSLILAKQTSGADAVFTALKAKSTAGFIVVRDGSPFATAYAVADVVDVYPVTLGGFQGFEDREANSLLRYEIQTMISDEPAFQVAVTT